jgi:hypothetical protein
MGVVEFLNERVTELTEENEALKKANDSLSRQVIILGEDSVKLADSNKVLVEENNKLSLLLQESEQRDWWYSPILERYNSGNYDGFECFVFAKGKLFDSDIDSADIICHFDEEHGTIIFPQFVSDDPLRMADYIADGVPVRLTYEQFMQKLYDFTAPVTGKIAVRAPYVKRAEFRELADLLPTDNERRGRIETAN